MSLEAALEAHTEALLANTAAILEQNSKLDIMLGKAGASSVASDTGKDDTEAKPKRTRTSSKKEENGNDDAPAHTAASVKALAGAWLAEFAKDQNDPETQARKDKLKSTLTSLAKKEGFEAADPKKGVLLTDVPAEHLGRVVAWLEKQPSVDNGFGEGRLTEVPGEDSTKQTDADEI